MPQRKKLSAIVISNNDTIENAVHSTLSHIYPGLRTTTKEEIENPGKLKDDLVIVDSCVVNGSKLDLLLDRLPDVPVLIVVDGMSDVHSLSHLIQGRREFITMQGIEGLTMIQSVHHLLDRQRLHAQLKKTAQHLKELSIRDDMTRLFNHRHFNEVLTQEVKKSNRYKRPLGLVMIALKNFTSINETYGHSEGDRLLSRSAGIVSATVRDVDITARYGDNEFAVILPETDEEASIRAGERIYKALGQLTVTDGEEQKSIDLSVGVAALNDSIRTKEELLKSALRALIEAKRCGKKYPIKSASETNGNDKCAKENRQLIESLRERLDAISRRSERTYFQEVLKTISEIPVQRKFFNAHAERVAFFAERLAAKLGLGEDEVRQIRRASLLHDVGKLAIDTSIIGKPTSLSDAEMQLVQQHPLFGTQIIGQPRVLGAEPEIILYHHERFDGSGYPEGVTGTDIPLGARIVAITEAWDTMITPQPYRNESLPLDRAISELKEGAGKQFDPDLVDTFTSLITG